jgi:hypothetical protein
MIVATINSQEYILENLKDAETLLEIMSRANPVDHSYNSDYKSYYYPDRSGNVGITITHCELVSLEEHARRLAERAAKDHAEKVPS